METSDSTTRRGAAAAAAKVSPPWRLPAFFVARRRRPLLAAAGALLTAAALAGCRSEPPASVDVAPGVTFHRDARLGVQLLDIDLGIAHVRPVVVADHVENRHGNYVGDAKTVAAWARQYPGALGGVNGGFFGDTYDQLGRRKQIVQLAVVDGKIVAPADVTLTGEPDNPRYVRAAVGFTTDGVPEIAWGTGNEHVGVRRRESPDGMETSRPWTTVRWAVAAGPRLFAGGAPRITDADEHLRLPGRLPRAFVAYDRGRNGRPAHLVLGRADAMEFTQVADYLTAYFTAAYGTVPYDALCLDGGPSAQIVYRDPQNHAVIDAEPTGVQVPTAILLMPEGAPITLPVASSDSAPPAS